MNTNNTTPLSLVENKANCVFNDTPKHTHFMKRVKSMSCLMASLSLCLIMLSGCGPKQKELADVAKISNGDGVGAAAIVKLTDQALLTDVACNANADTIRSAAVQKLTDQVLLASIAKNEAAKTEIRIAAIKKITDQALLAPIVKSDYDEMIRAAAVDNLTDQALLANIIKNDSYKFVRNSARIRLHDLSGNKGPIIGLEFP